VRRFTDVTVNAQLVFMSTPTAPGNSVKSNPGDAPAKDYGTRLFNSLLL
jgi:hypothetical protein